MSWEQVARSTGDDLAGDLTQSQQTQDGVPEHGRGVDYRPGLSHDLLRVIPIAPGMVP